jgi:hypothetical protein
MKHAGVGANTSELLVKRLAEAESRMPPEKVAMFSRFEGLVMMDASGAHPPAHHGHHGKKH